MVIGLCMWNKGVEKGSGGARAVRIIANYSFEIASEISKLSIISL